MNLIQEWYDMNFNMLKRTLKSQVKHGLNYDWVRIERFPLPPQYNKSYTKLLIVTPGLSGIENQFGYQFYLTMNLRRTDGISMKHYFDYDSYNDFSDIGYARICFHLNSFKPTLDVISGDTLLDICQALYNFLAQKKGI